MAKANFVYTTVKNKAAARKLISKVLETGLAKCANSFAIQSDYVWNGKLESNPEVAIIFKTVQAKRLAQALTKLHPYQIPCIAVLGLSALNRAYRNWLSSVN